MAYEQKPQNWITISKSEAHETCVLEVPGGMLVENTVFMREEGVSTSMVFIPVPHNPAWVEWRDYIEAQKKGLPK